MSREYKKKISSMSNEVKELHPFLRELLPKLENVRRVEYTHGSNEHGADFVIELEHATLQTTYYAGVVVKVGTIKQDHDTIHRQIRECQASRYFDSGKKEIVVNEIWVVTNGGITHGAQRSIRSEFSGQSVNFVSGDDLARFAEQHLPNYWHELPIVLAQHFADLMHQLDRSESNSALGIDADSGFYIELELEDIQAEARLRGDSGTKRSRKKGSKKGKSAPAVDLYQKIQGSDSPVFIEGEMGSGKSKLMRQAIRRLCEPMVYDQCKLVPIFVSAGDFVEKYDSSIATVISSMKPELAIDVEDQEARWLVCIDGLDEVLTDSDIHSEMLSSLIKETTDSESTTAMVTMRSYALENLGEAAFDETTRLRVKPLSFKKITLFLKRACNAAEISDRLISDAQQSQLFRLLPQSPIAAILLSKLIKENHQDLPGTLPELYSKSVELMLGRWDQEKLLSTAKEYEAALAICSNIAEFMLDNNLSSIAETEARKFASDYLTPRAALKLDADTVFNQILDRSGIFSLDSLNGSVRFRHRSFAEFLYAKKRIGESELEVDYRYFNSYWTNTCFFYIGLRKDCQALLERILSFPASSASERVSKFSNAPHYLMAAITTPYEVTAKNLSGLFLEGASLYVEIRDNPRDFDLVEATEVQLLSVFVMVAQQQYAYEFFRDSLDSAATAIDTAIADEEVKKFALYFLGCVALRLGEPLFLEHLVQQYKVDELPFAVSFGIAAELKAERWNGVSAILKRREKEISKRLSRSSGWKLAARNLIETPLAKLPRK